MKRIAILSILVGAFMQAVGMPGSLLLVGGGTEQDTPNAWNAEAYKWAVQQAANKKVAIVHYESGSPWLENYFENACDAQVAKSYVIGTREDADKQAVYDLLTAYDMLFFRGGNQYKYYQTYKGTKTQDAIEAVFNRGGVIAGTSAGMAMLSGVMYTAAYGTVYPEECIEDPQNQHITLSDDFLQLFPGWVFDTHVAKRGRMVRSLAFMARWYFDHSERINAIALDEMTAMAIDSTMTAKVYGTGAARIFRAEKPAAFSAENNKMLVNDVKVHQLLQGWEYNFKTGSVTAGNANRVAIDDRQEHGNYTLLLSGSNNRVYNDAMMEHFVRELGGENDTVLLVKGHNTPDAEDYQALLNTWEVPFEAIHASAENLNNAGYLGKVQHAEKFLFVNNTAPALLSFIRNSDAGRLLKHKLERKGSISAFIGDDSRLAGKTVVENYKAADASFYHDLEFSEGLGLLDKTVIMPHTFYADTAMLHENTQTAVPYALARDTLVNGIWLSRKNYIKYYPEQDKSYIKSYGKWPVMVMQNQGGAFGFSGQTSYGYESDEPRMVAGLEAYSLHTINASGRLQIGSELVSTGFIREKAHRNKDIRIYPVPAGNSLKIQWKGKKFTAEFFDTSGNVVKVRKNVRNSLQIDTSGFDAGTYIVNFLSFDEKCRCSKKIIVKE